MGMGSVNQSSTATNNEKQDSYGNGGIKYSDSTGGADRALAQMTQIDYQRYLDVYRPKELELIEKAKTDTSLIDQAKSDLETTNPLMQGVSDRTASRYGATLTPMQQKQQKLTLDRGNLLGGIQGIADARIAQQDQNRALMGDLINIGQDVNRSSLGQMQTAATNEVNRKNANSAARAQRRAQNTQMAASFAMFALFA